MPTRNFAFADVGSIVEGYVVAPVTNNCSHTLNNNNFGSFAVQGSGSDFQAAGTASVIAKSHYRKTGVIDFDRPINPVPDGALITKVKIRLPSFISIAADATQTASNFSGASGIAEISSSFGTHLQASASDGHNDGPSTITISESVAGSAADIEINVGIISKADLIAAFANTQIDIVFIGPSLQEGVGASGCCLPGSASGSFNVGLDNWEFEVTFEEGFSINWNTPQPDDPVQPGSLITLTSGDDSIVPDIDVDMDLITTIDILIPDYLNPGTFITVPVLTWIPINPHLLTFIMPDWGGLSPTVIRVQITSTQFSGSVARQLYTIFLVSASGIYELVPGKASDTLYIEAEPGETIDVKIPNPFGRTGFFGK